MNKIVGTAVFTASLMPEPEGLPLPFPPRPPFTLPDMRTVVISLNFSASKMFTYITFLPQWQFYRKCRSQMSS